MGKRFFASATLIRGSAMAATAEAFATLLPENRISMASTSAASLEILRTEKRAPPCSSRSERRQWSILPRLWCGGSDVADERLSVEDAIGLIAVQIETCRPISTTASTGNLK